MKFNCNRVEALASGDRCPSQPSFFAGVLKEGSFIARIKRTGQRTKHIGWVDLRLLDSDRLAICHGDEQPRHDEADLMFPLIKGSEFGDVKRHGNALTLHAMRVSLVLESEVTGREDEESTSSMSGTWSRILNRLISGDSVESSGSPSYFGGLGISVQAPNSVPHVPIKSAPLAASNANLATASVPTVERPRLRTKQLVPEPPVMQQHPPAQSLRGMAPPTIMPRGAPGNVQSMYAPQISGLPDLSMPTSSSLTSIPNSRSLKRISLCLANPSDFGFGDDLKTVLSALDEPEEMPEEHPEQQDQEQTQREQPEEKDEIPTNSDKSEPSAQLSSIPPSESRNEFPSALLTNNEFDTPNAPFSNSNDPNSVSSTPSPNALYLATDDEHSPPLDFGVSSPKRLTSILAKEQQQYLEKYGSRASVFSTYGKIDAGSTTDKAREPPKIPAPMATKVTQAMSEKFSPQASTVRPESIVKSTTASQKPQRKKSDLGHSKKEIKDNTMQEAVSSAKTGPVLRRKTVSIAPMVHVIKESESESEDQHDDCHHDADNESGHPSSLPLPSKSSAAASTSSLHLNSPQPQAEHHKSPRFVKAMKRILGKKKSKSNGASGTATLNALPRVPPKGAASASKEAGTAATSATTSAEGKLQPTVSNNSTSTSSMMTSNENDEAGARDSLPTPESLDEELPRHHVYANLLNSEDPTPEDTAGPVSVELKSEAEEPRKHVEEEKPQIVVVSSTNNGRTTAAVPKLHSSRSIAALSFRSLSSRSLSSRMSTDEANDTASTTPEKTLEGSQDDNTKPSVTAESRGSASPTLLRRESRQDVDPVPISLDMPGTLVSKMYENKNKSTSAIAPPLSNPVTVAPAPHQHHPSASSSYSSIGSKRSLHSYTSSLSSASSFSTPNLAKTDISLFTANLWVSVWSNKRWKPLSQLELKSDIVVSDANMAKINVVNADVSVKFTPQCEIRKVGNHDVEVRALDDTYMFRGRDPENAQRFYRTLWTLQANGVQPVAAAALASSASYNTLKGYDDDENTLLTRRRTMLPPTLSRSNQNLKYMGRSTETIIEE